MTIYFLKDSSLEDALKKAKAIVKLWDFKRKITTSTKVTIFGSCYRMVDSSLVLSDIPSNPLVDEYCLGPIDMDEDIVGSFEPFTIPNVRGHTNPMEYDIYALVSISQ